MDHEAATKQRVDTTIGTALVIVALLNGGVNAAIAKAVSQRGVSDPGVEGRIEFVGLFLSTFALSVTMTLAVVVLAVPRVYGRNWPWQLPLIVIAAGAPLAGLPVTHPNGSGAINNMIDSMRAFMVHYGPSFYGGVVVGVASGVIVAVYAQHQRNAVARPPLPWGFEVGVLVVVIVALSIAAERGLATARPSVPPARRDYAAEAKLAYLRNADAACARWVSQAPRGPSPDEARAWTQWAGNEIRLRKGMHADWQQVAAPEAVRVEVWSIMTDMVNAHNEFIAAVNDFVNRRNHWPAVQRYKRANTAAVARARGFGFNAEGCGYEWVVY
jgi:hypothetical protein